MNEALKNLFKAVRENPEFMALMEEALKHRPIVPAFMICKTKDEQEQVIEAIKYHTAMLNGFDFLYQYLTGKAPSHFNVKEIHHGRSTNAAD